MANPNFPIDGQSERIDCYVDATGAVYLKLAVANKAVAGATNAAAWLGTATHANGGTVGASDGVVLLAGLNGTTTKPVAVDTSGNLQITTASAGTQTVGGVAASGSAVSGNPVLVGGSDGTNARSVLTDTAGHPLVVPGGYTDGAETFASPRFPNIFKTASVTATGNTALWTPTSGKKFRLLRFLVILTGNATLGAAAVLTVKFQDATTDIGLSFDMYVPTSAGTNAGDAFVSPWVDIGPLGYISTTANNVLNVNLSAALTAGNVRVTAIGTEE